MPGQDTQEATRWIQQRDCDRRSNVAYATLDLSGPDRKVFSTSLPFATQIVDPFHVVKLANQTLDECRRRVQTELFGLRDRKVDPLYKARRQLTMAEEQLDNAVRRCSGCRRPATQRARLPRAGAQKRSFVTSTPSTTKRSQL